MSKKIFKNTLFVSAISIVAALLSTFGVIYGYFSGERGISLPREDINAMFGELYVYALIIAVASALISFFLAKQTSKSITKPINEINLEDPKSNIVYEELTPLIDKISAQNDEISRQIDELANEHDRQDSIRREFTANVSHELKTPLTSISGYAELIESGIAKPEDIQKFAGKIHDESQRLITLVGDILKISRLDENKTEVRREEIDLYATCECVINHLEKSIQDKNITVKLNGEHLTINCVQQIVDEIVFNLLDNAVKYNKPGGSITVTLKQCVDGAELAVSDSGIGICEDDIPHIFERFYRADKSHSKEIGGTGLGLSIVKHSANVVNAQISVESEINVGTTIRVLF